MFDRRPTILLSQYFPHKFNWLLQFFNLLLQFFNLKFPASNLLLVILFSVKSRIVVIVELLKVVDSGVDSVNHVDEVGEGGEPHLASLAGVLGVAVDNDAAVSHLGEDCVVSRAEAAEQAGEEGVLGREREAEDLEDEIELENKVFIL